MKSANINDYKPSGRSKLKPRVKKAWLEALRGNRRQVQGFLKARRDKDNRIGFCCLGVLCDLGEKSTEMWEETFCTLGDDHLCFEYDSNDVFPSDDVLHHSGLDSLDAGILASMNDDGIGFKRIANWIERHL